MSSYSTADTNAVDNRQAITDAAFGYSTYGGKGNQAAFAPLSNLKAGGSMTLSMLDGDAVAGAFGFAKSVMSESIKAVIDGQKATAQAASQVTDSATNAINQAVQNAGQAAQQSSAAQQATSAANTDKLMQAGKYIAAGLAVIGLLYYWKGRK
jgi:hypothetical protein